MQTVEKRIPASVALHDRVAFLKLVMAEFNRLHVGNAVRFGIRVLEFSAWQSNNDKEG